MAIRMSQQQNRFFGMVHDFIRQTGLIVSDQRDAILSGNIFRGNDHEFIPGDAGAECDFPDPAARNPAANGCAEEHVGQDHIVDVLRPAGHLVASLFTRNRIADDGIAVHLASQRASHTRGWDSVSQTWLFTSRELQSLRADGYILES